MGAWKQSIPQQVLLIAKSMVEAHLDACQWRGAFGVQSTHLYAHMYMLQEQLIYKWKLM